MVRVIDKGAVVVDKSDSQQEILADSLVLNPGFIPQKALAEQLKSETDLEVYEVGDCVSPRRIYDAIHEAFVVANSL